MQHRIKVLSDPQIFFINNSAHGLGTLAFILPWFSECRHASHAEGCEIESHNLILLQVKNY